MNKFDECDSCINRELDPYQCEDCYDACNYEGEEEAEEISLSELMTLMKAAA